MEVMVYDSKSLFLKDFCDNGGKNIKADLRTFMTFPYAYY